MMAVGLALSHAALFVVRPVTSYRLLELGEPAAAVGVVGATYAIAPLVFALWAGRIAAGRWTELLALTGSILLIGGCVGLAVMNSIATAVAASVVLGIANLGQMIAWQSLVARESRPEEYDRNFGWFTAGGSIGQLAGPIVGTAVMSSHEDMLDGTTAACLVAAAAASVCAVLSIPLLLNPERRPVPASPPPREQLKARTILGHPGVMAAMYVSLMVLAAVDLLSVYLPVLGEEVGLAPIAVGLLLGVRALFSLVSRLFLGTLRRWLTRRLLLMFSSVLGAAVLATIPLTSNVGLLAVMMAVLGVGLGVGQPLTMSWTAMLVPPHARSTALSLRLVGNRLGQVSVPAVAAGVTVLAGTAGVFWLLSGLLGSAVGVVARRAADHE